ncbi:hypothetical protein NZK35_14595 [Stieleria sp. ICT_E10.1]|uniref:hypothetical protein n=1 Tax=Stieleria sedimenti TaxID=2976331 RepID=UPI00217F6983|nr:hypothetical protein [Stieleria sedimenti]MCS7467879.1 hypothetical protein [Stieleria sedimenti]
MAASNRAKLITKLHTELKKKYTLPPSQPSRPLLEHLLYACLLQDAPYDLADEGLAKCEQEFFDWNEVRVTTVTELTQVLSGMPDPAKTARRLKEILQAVFEEFYAFDLDHLKKENLGKAVARFESMPVMTPFVLSYTIQHGLGGHSIPVDYAGMVIMLATGIASQNEAADGKIPGLERAIPKNKALEFSALLHQAGVDLLMDHNDKKARTLIDAVAKGSSERYDEWEASKKAAIRRVKKRRRDEKAAELEAEAEAESAKQAKAAKSAKKGAAKSEPAKTKTSKSDAKAASGGAGASKAKPASAKKSSGEKKSADKSAETKETAKKKVTAKKSDAKESADATTKKTSKKAASSSKSSATKATPTKKSTNRKLSKRKPR